MNAIQAATPNRTSPPSDEDTQLLPNVGDNIPAGNASWSFGGKVADVFDDHVAKSVPFYRAGHDLAAMIADFFVTNGSVCYDLGCSTGTLTRLLAERHQTKGMKFRAYDREAGMVEHAREKCRNLKNVQIEMADIVELEMEKADFVVSYYTLQFIRPCFRQQVFNKVYDALNWGGAFLLFEKVRAADARFQDISTAIYTDYKLEQGYSPAEILAKSRSLKGVLEPFSTQGNLDLLRRAGFTDIMPVFKYVCFEGFLTIK